MNGNGMEKCTKNKNHFIYLNLVENKKTGFLFPAKRRRRRWKGDEE
jgi:hypothetical protein